MTRGRHPDPAGAQGHTVSSSYGTRRSELVDKVLVEDSEERVALGGRGRTLALWRVALEGLTA